MKLLGIDGAMLTLATTDVDRHSTETVMDRYKPFQNRNTGIAVNVENEVSIGSKETVVTPAILEVDTSKQKDIVVSGIKITIIAVQPYTIQYKVQDIMSKR